MDTNAVIEGPFRKLHEGQSPKGAVRIFKWGQSGRKGASTDIWEAENVERVPQSEKSGEAERLARLCRADAIRAGISDRDLEAAAGGDLVAL